MKLDKRTKDGMMALALGVLIGVAVYLIQRKLSKEGYEGEEGQELEIIEDETSGAGDEDEAEEGDEDETAAEEGDDEEEVDPVITESQDVGEEEIDEFEEELGLSKTIKELGLPGLDDMDEELDGESEEKKEEVDITSIAQKVILSEIAKALE